GSGRPTERTACRGAILPWWRCRAPDPLVSYIRVQFRTAQPRWELSKATVLHAKPGTALIDYKKTIVQNHAPQDAYQSEQRPVHSNLSELPACSEIFTLSPLVQKSSLKPFTAISRMQTQFPL